MGLKKLLQNKIVFIDTAPLIYYIENSSKYSEILSAFFKLNKQTHFKLLTSTLTLTEVLVHPFRQNKPDLANIYKSILVNSDSIQIINMNVSISVKAAKIRAESNYKTPDAIQLATAITESCDIFLTNDRRLKSNEIKSITLDEFTKIIY